MDIIQIFNENYPKEPDQTDAIKSVLKFFGVPEQKEGNKLCVAEYLKADRIDIHVPHELYDQLYISYPPKKINFIRSFYVTDKILLLPQNNTQLSWHYPEQTDSI